MPHFLFVPGWAMDASLWDKVLAELAETNSRDAALVREAGYFRASPVVQPMAGPVIAVGHSLGLMQILEAPPAGLVGLVSINGFSRFAAGAGFPAGIPVRLLDRMLARLDQDADATVAEFRQRCGLEGGLPSQPQLPALRQGLELLRDGDGRAALRRLGVPVLALAGRQDKIAPPALSQACFEAVEWVEAGGHLLARTHPAVCARMLTGFARSLA